MHDGSITFSTKLDNADLEKELSRLKKKVFRLEVTLGEKKYRRSALEDSLARANAELEELQNNAAVIGDRLVFDADAIEKMGALKQKIQEIGNEIGKCDKAIGDSNIKLAYAKQRYGEIAEKARDLRSEVQKETGAVVDGGETDYHEKVVERQERLFDQLRTQLTAAKDLTSEVSSYIGEKLSAAFEPVYQRMAPALDKIREKLSETFQPLADRVAPDLDYAKESVRIGLDGIRDLISGFSSKLAPDLRYAAESIQTGLKGIFSGIQGLPGKLSAAAGAVSPYIAAAMKIGKVVASLLKKVWEMAARFANGFTNALKRGAEAVYSFGSAVARNFVAALIAIGRLGGRAVKAISGIAKNFITLVKKLNVFSRLSETLSGAFKRLGNTIKSALVFSVIYKGLSLLREQVGAYLMVNEQFSTALRRLQGVLLTAFQPIYDVVVPALTMLVNALSHAIATLSQFFAGLFGTTAKKAQVNAKALYGEAKALEATGEAAEEAAGSLAGFDEINQIQTENKSGSSGGGSTPETGAIFDYDYEETPFDSWGEAFSAFLDKLLEGVPKLEDAFKKFADWLNDLSKKLYEMFTFPGVLDKVKQLGEDLADALNKLVDWIDWELLGRALGAGLNLALNFLTSFLYAFDWMNLGRKLAEFVNGLVDEIDWYEFGRLLWAGFKIALETLAGFILGLDMPLMAEAASNIILGFFDEMYNTIARIPWQEIGRQIARFLNGIDWYGTITSVISAIQAALTALAAMIFGFVNQLNWGTIARDIYRAINDSMGEIDWAAIGRVIGDAFVHIFNFLRDIVAGINWYEIGQNIADLILGFDFVSALGSLADLIAEGINAAIQLVRGFLDKIMPEIQNIASGIVERLENALSTVKWSELGGVIGDGIKTALTFIAGLLDPELFYEVGKAIGDFLVNLDWVEIVGGLTEVLANGIKAAVAAVKGLLDSVVPHLKETAEGIAQKINEFVEKVDWKELGQAIHDGINAALDFLITILDNLDWDEIGQAVVYFLSGLNWGELLRKWGDVVGKALGGAMKGIDLGDALWLGNSIIDGIWRGMLNKWDESGGIVGWIKRKLFEPFVNGFKSLFGINSPSTVMAEQGEFLIEGLKQGITDTWSSITDFFSEKLDALEEILSETWENIKEAASEKWESIKSSLGEIWDHLKETAREKFDGIKEKTGEAWEAIKSDSSEKWEAIKSDLSTKWDSIKENAKSKFDEVKKKITDAWDNINKDTPGKWEEIKTTLSGAWEQIKTTAGEKFEDIKGKIIEKLEGIKDKDWYQTGKSVVDSILSGLESIWNSLTSWAGKVKDKIADAFSGTSGSRSGGFGTTVRSGSFGGRSRMAVASMPDITNFEIPALARGAVIPPNREFLAILGDQRGGNNLEAPESLLRRIAREESGSGEVIALLQAILDATKAGKTIMVDRKVLGQTVTDEQHRRTRAAGR